MGGIAVGVGVGVGMGDAAFCGVGSAVGVVDWMMFCCDNRATTTGGVVTS